MSARPSYRHKSLRDVVQATIRVVEILGNDNSSIGQRNMFNALDELNAEIKRFNESAWIRFDHLRQDVLVDIGNGPDTLKATWSRIEREEAARFKLIGVSSTREDLPSADLVNEALTGIGAITKNIGHGLPPRDLYLTFLALELPQPSEWSLIVAQAELAERTVPVRLSLPMQVRNDLVVLGLAQPGNDIHNTIKPSAEAVGYFWFAWRPEPNHAGH